MKKDPRHYTTRKTELNKIFQTTNMNTMTMQLKTQRFQGNILPLESTMFKKQLGRQKKLDKVLKTSYAPASDLQCATPTQSRNHNSNHENYASDQ